MGFECPDGYMEYDLDNGITLCLKCHRQLHGVNGIIKDEEETED